MLLCQQQFTIILNIKGTRQWVNIYVSASRITTPLNILDLGSNIFKPVFLLLVHVRAVPA